MRHLGELRDSDIFPGVPNDTSSDFSEKETARAIVIDQLGQIALFYVGNYTYHKLPGGGVEEGETPRQALDRELLEEMGYSVQILAEVGKIVEHKNEQNRTQTSYCYLVRQAGASQPPNLTDSEVDHDYQLVWAPSLHAATQLVEEDEPIGYSRKFIQRRELTFLQAAEPFVFLYLVSQASLIYAQLAKASRE